jgi:hypothetical protein
MLSNNLNCLLFLHVLWKNAVWLSSGMDFVFLLLVVFAVKWKKLQDVLLFPFCCFCIFCQVELTLDNGLFIYGCLHPSSEGRNNVSL